MNQNQTMQNFAECLITSVRETKGNLKEARVSDISYDSRTVQKGTLFFCKGNAFRKEYLEQALARGAVGYVSEKAYDLKAPAILVTDMRSVLAPAAQLFFDHPEKKLRFFGITGTKGKSSTAWYLRHMLEEHAKTEEQAPVGFLSSMTTFDGKTTLASSLTTPEPFELYSILANCVENGVHDVVMEVSSQALKYQRTEGIHFAYGAFLNISPDHVSAIEHPSFDDYFHSKLALFAQSDVAVINGSTDHLSEVREAAGRTRRVLQIGYDSNRSSKGYEAADLRATLLSSGEVLRFRMETSEDSFEVELPEMGHYAMENAAVASAIALDVGVRPEEVHRALANLHVPGRMQRFDTKDGKITVIVDLAHNGISYRAISEAIREPFSDAEIIAVFGSAGGKALNRRKDIGREANRFADYVILTMEDPNEEPLDAIDAEIASELTDTHYERIDDRKEALERAFAMASRRRCEGKRTLILALGKGDESHMRIQGISYPYVGDASLVRDIMNAAGSDKSTPVKDPDSEGR